MIRPMRQMEKHKQSDEIAQSWTILVPALSIVGIILFSAVVPLVTTQAVLPDLGLALLISWRLYRPDLLAPWAGLPLGIIADILTGLPVGISATAWPAILLALTLIEPRFPIRDMRMDWLIAAALIALAKVLDWQLLGLVHFPLPFAPVLLNIISTILFFPLIARLAAWMERKWLAVG